MSNLVIWKLNPSQSHPSSLEKISPDPLPVSLNAASRLLPGGVYTTFRTYEGNRSMPLEDHLQRLEESARLVGASLTIDRPLLRQALHDLLQDYPTDESRVRLTVDLQQDPGTIYIALEPLLTPSPEDYARGVLAVTCDLQRENPASKQTSFIAIAERIRRTLPPEANEGLLLDERSYILEGLSSNFFAVKERSIWTVQEGVLPGITRSLVLRAAQALDIPVRLEPVSIHDIPNLDEAFITSSSRSVLPLRQVDSTPVGSAAPGPVTQALAQAYWQEIRQRLEEV